MADLTTTTTVAELAEFIQRQQMALSEAGRPDLAEVAHVVVTSGGGVRFCCRRLGGNGDPTVEKALRLDPMFTDATPRSDRNVR